MGEPPVQGPMGSPTFREVQRKLTLSLEDLVDEGKKSGDTEGRRRKNRGKSRDADGRPARRRRTRERGEEESESKPVSKETGDPPPSGSTPGPAVAGPPQGAPPTSPVPPPGFHPYPPPPWGYAHPGRPPLGPVPGMPPLDMYGRPAYDPRRPYPGVPLHGPPPRGFAPHPGMMPYPYAHHALVPGMPGFEARAPPRPGYEPYPSPHGARPHHPVDARERPEGHAPVPGGPPPPRAPAHHHPAHATHPPPQAGPPPAHTHHAQSSQQPTHSHAVSRQASNGTPAVLTAAPKRVGYQIRLSNVPPELTARDLAEAFCEVSQSRVESVDVLRDGDGRANGQAVVIFNSMADAQNAVQRYHGGDLNGRRLQVVLEGEVAHS